MENSEEDVKFIADETLDCGGLSPSDSHEEEDIAVLETPEKPLRRGLSHRSNPNTVAPAPQGVRFSLGPLSPEKLEEILEEANRLAAQLEQCALQERESSGEGPGPRRGKPSPRRETFVLKDSPVRDLLPTVSSLAWSTPSPSSLTPRLRSTDKKGVSRGLRVTSGKRPSPVKRESPTCNLFPASKSPALSPLVQSTLARSVPPLQSTALQSTPVRPTPPSRSTPPLRSTPPPRSAPPLRSTPPPRSTPPNRSALIRSTPPHRSTPPIRSAPPQGKTGPPVASMRATASPPTPVRPVLPSTSNTQRLPRPQGAAAKTSSRLPIPSAIPRPPCRMPLTSHSVPPGKGALPPDSLSSRKGFSRSNAAGHKAPLSQQPSLAVRGATRSSLQPPRKVAVPGPAR